MTHHRYAMTCCSLSTKSMSFCQLSICYGMNIYIGIKTGCNGGPSNFRARERNLKCVCILYFFIVPYTPFFHDQPSSAKARENTSRGLWRNAPTDGECFTLYVIESITRSLHYAGCWGDSGIL